MPALLKVNYFSPLPPAPTEIANHTVTVARALAHKCELGLWTDQGTCEPSVENLAPVRRFNPEAPPWREMNRADANVFAIGNNASFHSGIVRLARHVPGIVILHDTRLQHLFAASGERPGPDRDWYLAAIERAHGPEAAADALRRIAGELDFETLVARYPMRSVAVDRALAAVVHNPVELAAVREATRAPVDFLPLCFPPGPLPPPRAEGSTAPRDRPFRLVVFGFIGTNRRIASILEAIAGMPDPDRFMLDIYGRPENDRLIDEPVARHGAARRVRRHGYVAEAVLDAALAEADLVLNLRWPSMGEASASQLRIWRAAAPALVTRTGYYATLPEDSVFFVEPDDEIGSIQRHLAALERHPAAFASAGRRGREILERDHAPEAYAEALLGIVREAPMQHARRAAFDLARRGAAELLGIMEPAHAPRVAPRVAEAITGLFGAR